MKSRILLVDDDSMMFEVVEDMNSSELNFSFLQNPDKLFEYLENNKIDLILMDWNIGDKSGTDYVKMLRARRDLCNIPVIMLTGNSKDNDVIGGLSSGADDYVTKPFNPSILKARILANLRKGNQTPAAPIKFDENIFQVELAGKKLALRKKEFLILKALVENPGKTLTRQELNGMTTGEDVHVSDRSIDTFVRYLRSKLPLDVIQSVRGQGYKLNEKEMAKLLK